MGSLPDPSSESSALPKTARAALWIGGGYLTLMGGLRSWQVLTSAPGVALASDDLALPIELAIALLIAGAGVLVLTAALKAVAQTRTAGKVGLIGAVLSAIVGTLNPVVHVLAAPAPSSPSLGGERVGEVLGAGFWLMCSLALVAASRALLRTASGTGREGRRSGEEITGAAR